MATSVPSDARPARSRQLLAFVLDNLVWIILIIALSAFAAFIPPTFSSPPEPVPIVVEATPLAWPPPPPVAEMGEAVPTELDPPDVPLLPVVPPFPPTPTTIGIVSPGETVRQPAEYPPPLAPDA